MTQGQSRRPACQPVRPAAAAPASTEADRAAINLLRDKIVAAVEKDPGKTATLLTGWIHGKQAAQRKKKAA